VDAGGRRSIGRRSGRRDRRDGHDAGGGTGRRRAGDPRRACPGVPRSARGPRRSVACGPEGRRRHHRRRQYQGRDRQTRRGPRAAVRRRPSDGRPRDERLRRGPSRSVRGPAVGRGADGGRGCDGAGRGAGRGGRGTSRPDGGRRARRRGGGDLTSAAARGGGTRGDGRRRRRRGAGRLVGRIGARLDRVARRDASRPRRHRHGCWHRDNERAGDRCTRPRPARRAGNLARRARA
jgi:hypothetical protein